MFSGEPAKDFLNSMGFVFTDNPKPISPPPAFTPDQLINSRYHRNECRKCMSRTDYGYLFEYLAQQVLIRDFKFDVLRGVKIREEGEGGDFDVLAFQSPYLHYIECKTGIDIGFSNIQKRRDFLRPASALVIIDQGKEKVVEIVRQIEEESVRTSTQIHSECFLLFNIDWNIYIASGEDIRRAIRRTLRHFHQFRGNWYLQKTNSISGD